MGEELRILVTLLVDLWWLISTQIHHFDLFCSSFYFSLVSFGLLHGLELVLFFLLLGSLGFLELLKYVLVVKKSMGKLVSEI